MNFITSLKRKALKPYYALKAIRFLVKNGYPIDAVWSLDDYYYKHMIIILNAYVESANGYPHGVTFEEHIDDVKGLIGKFQWLADNNYNSGPEYDEWWEQNAPDRILGLPAFLDSINNNPIPDDVSESMDRFAKLVDSTREDATSHLARLLPSLWT